MKNSHPPLARILNHDSGLGAPSSETVRIRALELARIDGRRTYSPTDWQQARQELHGGTAANAHGAEMSVSLSERDMIITDRGHHVENLHHDDAEHALEELVAEGMEEAVHEQMLAASRVAEEDEEEQQG